MLGLQTSVSHSAGKYVYRTSGLSGIQARQAGQTGMWVQIAQTTRPKEGICLAVRQAHCAQVPIAVFEDLHSTEVFVEELLFLQPASN